MHAEAGRPRRDSAIGRRLSVQVRSSSFSLYLGGIYPRVTATFLSLGVLVKQTVQSRETTSYQGFRRDGASEDMVR